MKVINNRISIVDCTNVEEACRMFHARAFDLSLSTSCDSAFDPGARRLDNRLRMESTARIRYMQCDFLTTAS